MKKLLLLSIFMATTGQLVFCQDGDLSDYCPNGQVYRGVPIWDLPVGDLGAGVLEIQAMQPFCLGGFTVTPADDGDYICCG